MGVVVLLIGFSLIVAIGFLVAFIWSVRNGQYEDDYSPSVRILFDDEISSQNPSQDDDTEEEVTAQVPEPKTNN
jgi:cbb3-type cytochrome oxidase maturation protein